MAAVQPSGAEPALPRGREPLWPAGFDAVTFGLLVLGFALLYVPTYVELSRTIWASDEQGHGPIILAVSAWLLYQKRHVVAAIEARPQPRLGWALLVLAMAMFAFGTSQHIISSQVSSQIVLIAALMLIFRGPVALKAVWFPLFFLIFMIPLPEALVAAVTAPLKSAVSAVASQLLYVIGYPVGRSGVLLTVGPYQLLVADACAGLNSMFTLEALGMLYMNLMNYTSVRRNVALAVLLIPIAFCANIVRVMILVLVTYHFGDEAGQGFVHGFAGIVLFMVALMLMLVTDKLLGLFLPAQGRAAA